MTSFETAQVPPPSRFSNILLLSCMDLRLLDETVAFMDSMGLTNRYDHVILAGASLGATYEGLPHWGQTFWDHVQVARELHDIQAIYILEHRQCGAYRKWLGLDSSDELVETLAHSEIVSRLKMQIQARHPDLGVRGFLMGLDGGVIELLSESPQMATDGSGWAAANDARFGADE